MSPPIRTKPEDYHFYAFDYDRSRAYTLSDPVPGRKNMKFYSMREDIFELCSQGYKNGVPNISPLVSRFIQQDGVNRQILGLTFGGDEDYSKPKVLLTGGIHAREWVAPAITYLIAEYLIINYTTAPENDCQKAIKDLIDNRHITIMPMLNPHGNMYSIFSSDKDARMWRKNRRLMPVGSEDWFKALTQNGRDPNPPFLAVRKGGMLSNFQYDVPVYKNTDRHTIDINTDTQHIGVDLARNFDVPHWGYDTLRNKGKTPNYNGNPIGDDYFGQNRGSEDETKVLQKDMFSVPPDVAIEYHSYSKFILYPSVAHYDGKTTEKNYQKLGELMQLLIVSSKDKQGKEPFEYALGCPLDLVGYDALGTISDYQAAKNNARAYVVELDPGSKEEKIGFELPEDQIMAVFEKNIRAALALINEAGEATKYIYSGPEDLFWDVFGRGNQFLAWNVFGRGNQLPAV